MPTQATITLLVPEDMDPDLFLRDVARYLTGRRATVTDTSTRPISPELQDAGLPAGLTVGGTAVQDITTLAGWSETGLLAEPGIRYGRLRRIKLALANRGLTLRDCEPVQPDDMIERLPVTPEEYGVLLRRGYRRLSQLCQADRVDIAQFMSASAVVRALGYLGLKLAPLHPGRTLGDLGLGDYVSQILGEIGVEPEELVADLTASRLSVATQASETGRDPQDVVCLIRTMLGELGVELHD